MSKILFLDDDLKRQKAFLQANIGENVTVVSTYEECIKALMPDVCEFSIIHLDHDLTYADYERFEKIQNISQYKLEGPVSGGLIADYIAENHEKFKHVPIVLHSFNKVGVEYMREQLHKKRLHYLVQPFIAVKSIWWN